MPAGAAARADAAAGRAPSARVEEGFELVEVPPAAAPKRRAEPKARGYSILPLPVVNGPLPPVASSTGRRYYVVEGLEGGTVVAAGYARAIALNGGAWVGRGRIPTGYGDLETALNAVAAKGETDCKVAW